MSKKNSKTPVYLKPFHKTKYSYEKLKVCKKCHAFSILGDKTCPDCGKPDLIPVEEQAARNAKHSMHTAVLIAVCIGLLSIFLSNSFLQMALCGIVTIVLIGVLWIVQRNVLDTESIRALDKLFYANQKNVQDGIIEDYKAAIDNWDTDKQRCYEMLREIGTLLHNDMMRLRQLTLLQTFLLRKDMDLELEPLLVRKYEPVLVDYIGELAKIKRDLIKDRTFQYIMAFEPEIMGQEQGLDILTAVAGAAVRMKHYVRSYAGFVRRYAYNLPKDRFLRLYQMIEQYPNEDWGRLSEEVMRIYTEKYQWDPDFQQKSQRGHSI
ncbi:hypothetical protein BVG16_22695 [Paenibacillus selenitireducens]|uniref:Uncharacterized protein n=1 Tax=Paenibacillus selenitireducens TaxID=1324314 RepID=A0A1T2X3V4_9BACL|nr:hypothetical protein [Paenibacillus selenitireducens]OPA74578.1 hypothetical protein BVG16_22695 [Paenibacillus selenitireducens]